MRPALWFSEGWRTFDNRPLLRSCSDAYSQEGHAVESCSQWAKDASSHQPASFCIASRCGEFPRKGFIAASACHVVSVQKASSLVLRNWTPRFPAALLAWRANPATYHENGNRKRIALKCRRVTDTNAMTIQWAGLRKIAVALVGSSYCSSNFFPDLMFVQTVEEFFVVQLFNEAHVDEIFGFGVFRLGVSCGEFVDDRLQAGQGRIGLFRDNFKSDFPIGFFQRLAVGGLKISAQDLDARLLLRLVEMNGLYQRLNYQVDDVALRPDKDLRGQQG